VTTSTSSLDEILAAASAARQPWARQSAVERAAVLRAVADALDAAGGTLVPIAEEETHLPTARLTGELTRTTFQLRLHAIEIESGRPFDIRIDHADPTWGMGPRPDLRRMQVPLGPVVVFAAGNFPFAFSVAGGDTSSALAAGCPVVVKAHEGHPRTSVLTARIVAGALAGAGAPAGTFAVVFGVAAGVRLLQHPAIAAAGFTGSARGGLALAAICAQRPVPIPFFGELGSVNPVVILPGAAAARPADIAAGYAASLTLGAGQFCTNPGLLFVPAGDERLRPAIAGAIQASAGGPMLTARIHDSFSAAVAELGARPGVAELAEGQEGDGPWSATPAVFEVGLADFAAGLPGLAQERFGPVGLVITYRSLADLLPVLARLGGNLAGVVHADEASAADMELARQVADVLARTVGRVVFNGWPTGVAVTHAQHHGGPWPASTAPAYTSVGAAAIRRWLVPVAYQDFPAELLPAALSRGGR
jgi:NADP-dependent aldehyde dehydrogenase